MPYKIAYKYPPSDVVVFYKHKEIKPIAVSFAQDYKKHSNLKKLIKNHGYIIKI